MLSEHCGCKRGYVQLFLARVITFSLLVSVSISAESPDLLVPIALFQGVYFVVVLVMRPHEDCFSNLTVAIN